MVTIPDDILVKFADYICDDNNDIFPYRTGKRIKSFLWKCWITLFA